MAKTATIATLSPLVYATGNPIWTQQVQTVVEMLNYAYKNIEHHHVNIMVSEESTSTDMDIHEIDVINSGSFGSYYDFDIYVGSDAATLECGATQFVPASNTGETKITIGASSTTITHNNSDNGNEKIGTITASAGWKHVTVEARRSSGTLTLRLASLRITEITNATIPDPPNE